MVYNGMLDFTVNNVLKSLISLECSILFHQVNEMPFKAKRKLWNEFCDHINNGES